MPDWSDVSRTAATLPGAVETVRWRHPTWAVADASFVWERPFTGADRRREPDPLPEDAILAARVADEGEKAALLAAEPEWTLTIQHLDGYPAVLIRLDAVPQDRLVEIVTDAWLAVAPADERAGWLAREGLDGH